MFTVRPLLDINQYRHPSSGGRLTDKGQQIDRFLPFTSQTDKKTDWLSAIKKLLKKQICENDEANNYFQTFRKENWHFM